MGSKDATVQLRQYGPAVSTVFPRAVADDKVGNNEEHSQEQLECKTQQEVTELDTVRRKNRAMDVCSLMVAAN